MDDNTKYAIIGGAIIIGIYLLRNRAKKKKQAAGGYAQSKSPSQITALDILNAKKSYDGTEVTMAIIGFGTITISALAVVVFLKYYADPNSDMLKEIKDISDSYLEKAKSSSEAQKIRDLRDKLLDVFKKGVDLSKKKGGEFYSFLGGKMGFIGTTVGDQEKLLEPIEQQQPDVMEKIKDIIVDEIIESLPPLTSTQYKLKRRTDIARSTAEIGEVETPIPVPIVDVIESLPSQAQLGNPPAVPQRTTSIRENIVGSPVRRYRTVVAQDRIKTKPRRREAEEMLLDVRDRSEVIEVPPPPVMPLPENWQRRIVFRDTGEEGVSRDEIKTKPRRREAEEMLLDVRDRSEVIEVPPPPVMPLPENWRRFTAGNAISGNVNAPVEIERPLRFFDVYDGPELIPISIDVIHPYTQLYRTQNDLARTYDATRMTIEDLRKIYENYGAQQMALFNMYIFIRKRLSEDAQKKILDENGNIREELYTPMFLRYLKGTFEKNFGLLFKVNQDTFDDDIIKMFLHDIRDPELAVNVGPIPNIRNYLDRPERWTELPVNTKWTSEYSEIQRRTVLTFLFVPPNRMVQRISKYPMVNLDLNVFQNEIQKLKGSLYDFPVEQQLEAERSVEELEKMDILTLVYVLSLDYTRNTSGSNAIASLGSVVATGTPESLRRYIRDLLLRIPNHLYLFDDIDVPERSGYRN